MITTGFGREKALGTYPTKEWKISSMAILTDKSTSNWETTQPSNLAAESSSRTKKKLCVTLRIFLLYPGFKETFALKSLLGQEQGEGNGYKKTG